MRLGTGAARESQRILVTDAETRGTVAVVRSLHRAGYRVSAAAPAVARPAAAQWSRDVDFRLSVPCALSNPAGFLDELERVLTPGGYATVVAGSDSSLLAMARGRDRLEPHLRSGLPELDVVMRCLDKVELISAAARNGVDAPLTVVCRGLSEASSAAREIGFPVMVKPTRAVFEVEGTLRRVGARLARDEPALESAVDAYGDSLLVQRREADPVLSFAGVFAEGRMLGHAVSRYHRTWRPDAGGASFSETIAAPSGLLERVASLMEDLGWNGLFELELIERPAGSWAVIDLNPRAYGSLAAAIRGGANLPAIWCGHVLGGDPPTAQARPGVFYRWEDADFRHALWQARRRRPLNTMRVLRVRRGVAHAHFDVRDPGPLLARAIYLMRSRFRRWRCQSGVS